MKQEKTHRGFDFRQFKDYYSIDCSIQKSSLIKPDCIWLGCDKAGPRVLRKGEGWQKVAVPENTLFNTRMHLTRIQVLRLLPYLIKFVFTGGI